MERKYVKEKTVVTHFKALGPRVLKEREHFINERRTKRSNTEESDTFSRALSPLPLRDHFVKTVINT